LTFKPWNFSLANFTRINKIRFNLTNNKHNLNQSNSSLQIILDYNRLSNISQNFILINTYTLPTAFNLTCIKSLLANLQIVSIQFKTTVSISSKQCLPCQCGHSLKTYKPILYYSIMVHVCLSIVIRLFEFIFSQNKILFFINFKNSIEICNYVCVLVCVNSPDYSTQSAYGSVAVCLSFIVFPLYLQKLKLFGVYVLALIKVVSTSIKFLPIFFILLTGFILTFTMRKSFGVSFTDEMNHFEYTATKTLAMVLGDFETISMGLFPHEFINFFVYILFLFLMCIIMLNLFVGIAVSDIGVVLNEADIRHLTLKVRILILFRLRYIS